MKQLTLLLIALTTSSVFAQETLDVSKIKDCELFPEKGKFDAEKRLNEIKGFGGSLVTVYLVKGKNNKIKSKYTGRVDLRSIDDSKLSLDTRTKVLVVTTEPKNGEVISYLPLTYDKSFRIYLTDCLEE
jgi:hypothetical protein